MACDEYCRVSRQQLEQRAEQAERERDEARAKVERLRVSLQEIINAARSHVSEDRGDGRYVTPCTAKPEGGKEPK